ncbi:unnamed protein product [Dibothriocephalus latus]|uniref:Uncharacterized protein n=1 Tax=Dibothriocephalus latus TaxID=60516 RepID=A0A3P7L816_DIBLA|nr:unnamed protein product [Dibothriocephalus latus]
MTSFLPSLPRQLFDMGSSFMDEVFKCFTLSISDMADTSSPQSAPTSAKPSCQAEATQPEGIPVYDDILPNAAKPTSSVSNNTFSRKPSSSPPPPILSPLTRDSPIQRPSLEKTDS